MQIIWTLLPKYTSHFANGSCNIHSLHGTVVATICYLFGKFSFFHNMIWRLKQSLHSRNTCTSGNPFILWRSRLSFLSDWCNSSRCWSEVCWLVRCPGCPGCPGCPTALAWWRPGLATAPAPHWSCALAWPSSGLSWQQRTRHGIAGTCNILSFQDDITMIVDFLDVTKGSLK